MSNFECHNNVIVKAYWSDYRKLDRRIAGKAFCDFDFPEHYQNDIFKKIQFFVSLMYTYDKKDREERLMNFMKNYFKSDIEFLLTKTGEFCNSFVSDEEFMTQPLFKWMIQKNSNNFDVFKLNIETILQQLTLISTPHEEVKNIVIRSVCHYLCNYFIKL